MASQIPSLQRTTRPRIVTLRHPQRLAILLVGTAVAAVWSLSGVPLGDAVRFAGYEALYVLLPGRLLYVALSPATGGRLRTLAICWPLGYAIELGAFALTAALHARAAFTFLPLAAAGFGALLLISPGGRRRLSSGLPMSAGARSGGANAAGDGLDLLAVAVILAVALAFLALTSFAAAPLPAHAHSVAYLEENVFDISLTAEVRHHWPITVPWIAGQPMRYYLATFIHGAAVNQVTGVPIATVFLRLFPTTMFVLGALQLWCLGRALGRSRWIGPLAVALFFLVDSLNLYPTHGLTLDIVPYGRFSGSPTFAYGAVFLLGLLVLLQSRVAARPERRRSPDGERRPGTPTPAGLAGFLALLAVLTLGCGAAKTFAAVDFVGGLGLIWLWMVLTGRSARLWAYCLLVSSPCLGAVYFAMLAGGGGGAGLLQLSPFHFLHEGHLLSRARGLAQILVGHSPVWVALLLAAVAVVALCMFVPLLGAIWLLWRRSPLSAFEILTMAVFVTGVTLYVLLGASGAENYFANYGFLAVLPVAARGLMDLWDCTPRQARRRVVGACGAMLALGLILTASSRVIPSPGRAESAWYLASYGLIGAGTVLLVFWLWGAYAPVVASRLGRVLACSIPLLCTLGLVRPISLAASGAVKTALHSQIARADSPANYGMTAALYRGLAWTRAHTRTCDVLAVNNHYNNTAGTLSAYFYYSAFTERRVFLESWTFSPGGVNGGSPFAVRLALNDRAVLRGDPAALRALSREGVSYVLVDKTHGGGAPEAPSVSRLVFSNSALDVYRLLTAPGAGRRALGCDAKA
jgi:hypothetical protein